MKPAVREPIPAEDDRQDSADFEACMAYVRAHAAGEVEGLFGPASFSWTVMREPGVLLSGLAAVLLQLAHPAVGTGVSRHSTFREDVSGRVQRTSNALYRLIFGSLPEAMAMSQRLYRVHRLVRGRIEAPGAATDGMAYRANERHLLRWVSATVSVSARLAFATFIRPLTAAEMRAWYLEYLLVGAATGVRPDEQPKAEEAFDAWYEGMVTGDELRVTPAARSVMEALFRSPVAGGAVGATLTAGLLPARVRELYGLPWGRWEQRKFRALAASVRRALTALPAPYRYVVAWHQAELRIARARGERAPLLGRSLDILGRRLGVPTSLGRFRGVATKNP